ncbi:response regulator [Pseudomonas sp. GD03842]|uniref:response regulator transcription factor n=1 Tax=Pseudomonas sp. GD03842 TaxID=2975385 RepID=UPI002448C9F7|nr:response regulator [Pseudomonas sp. GD03842]MDH0748893.1 response regulator [Pseudomonas sp. GD03842]
MQNMMVATATRMDEPVVFVVDDDPVLSGALASLLRSVGHHVVALGDPEELFLHPLAGQAACLILDVRLQGYSGFDLQRRLSDAGSRLPVIFITGYGDIPMSVRAMKAGAVDFLTKPFSSQDLIDAVARALAVYAEYLQKQEAVDALRRRFECLTPRERQVMGGVANGFLNKQIASQLEVSEITVKLHRANMMKKMHVRTVADVVRASRQLELS